ncbi:hypothetical protein D6D28_06329 [Aureobasidium pullulans]|uniref:Uncharacterized protein n=1 Tax=Aureobasidium pullulans TaxID=5580 RepID=A0A4S8SE99_AURPU|nr:hypothetical protein D6D28_06329 [Aureobasidium pullulans]
MEISQKNTTRWQRLTHGYNKYWYCKAALRWLALVTAVVTLITFGATWRDYTLYSQYDVGYVYESLAITCPLIAVIVDVFAIVLLFRTRKNSNINPVFLLAGDTLTLPLLIIDMAITCPGEFGFHVSTASVEFPLVMVWGLTVGLTALHLILFITSIWETHIFRAMRREQKMSGSVSLQDLKHRSQDLESDTSTISSVTEGPIRVELPDGRIFELPEGTSDRNCRHNFLVCFWQSLRHRCRHEESTRNPIKDRSQQLARSLTICSQYTQEMVREYVPVPNQNQSHHSISNETYICTSQTSEAQIAYEDRDCSS